MVLGLTMTEKNLKITEIFYSLQGEANTSGRPTVFIRLTGCPLRCHYCDSEYAFHGGHRRSLDYIVAQVASFNARYVCVTGGEPLAQPEVHELMKILCDDGYKVSLETSGAISMVKVDARVVKVMDIKTPDSGEVHRNLLNNIDYLTAKDQVKFVLCSREDYNWAKMQLDIHRLTSKVVDVLFSPSFDQIEPKDLAEWIIEDNLDVRFQLQLHKQLWGDRAGV